jgi:hypothetical protein
MQVPWPSPRSRQRGLASSSSRRHSSLRLSRPLVRGWAVSCDSETSLECARAGRPTFVSEAASLSARATRPDERIPRLRPSQSCISALSASMITSVPLGPGRDRTGMRQPAQGRGAVSAGRLRLNVMRRGGSSGREAGEYVSFRAG